MANAEIKSSVIAPCNTKIKKEKDNITRKIQINERRIIRAENKIKEYKDEIENILSKIEANNEKLDIVLRQKKHDKETLNKYLQYAEVAYLRQRNNIINKINSDITTSERILYILFLGVLENDYESLINASNE